MDYRLLLFEDDKYTERVIDRKSLGDVTPFCRAINEAGETELVLPSQYEALATRGKQVVKIGNASSCSIRPNSETPYTVITGRSLESHGEVYVNGEKVAVADLTPGDKILIGETEFIYHEEWLEICGVCGETYETDLISYIGKPERFDDFPIYKRSPRIIKTEPYAKIQIKTPDKEERQKKGELVKRILPSCVMIIATILMSVFMRRGMFMMVMVAATGATMIITVVTYFDDKKAKAAEKKERTEAYEEYLLKKRKELYDRTEEFKESKRYHNLSLVKIEDEVKHYSNRIYERNFNDEDFLTVSLGTAPGVPSFKIECDDEGYGRAGDKLYSEMLDIYNNFKDVQDIPYVVDLKKSHLGIVGRPEYCRARLRDIVTQTAFFQSYHDVCIVPVVGEANNSEYDWMHWLPHTEIRSINVSGVIIGENQRDQVLGHIARELKARSLTRDESRKETRFTPHYVFLIDESKLIINHSIMEHLKEEGSELGFTLIYITQTEKNLPENVKTILEVEAKNEGKVLMDEGHLINKKLEFDMANIDYETFARRLKPLIHNKGVTTQIPENISFLELYGVKSPAEIDVRNLWNSNATHRSLSVPLGVRGKGDIVTLDLHEKAHGPHGLVAGTTGSGKSEILQSYILSLACNFHPHDVGFLLIDYKGGGMANLFRKLPHLLGTITNLDGAESMRALASIKSELKRRQDVFNRNGVNNINKYSEKFRAGQATEPMPHLFIISDEFAELKKEQPEFMAELVSTARVGRSLGVHLILATQKPTGIVDDQIWSNSRFKLCLKVQNEADSRELLHSGDAANITNPGRAYLQVGNNEIFELFQSAYSGGAYSIEKEQSEADERIFVLNELGQGRLINEDLSLGESNEINKVTQLDAVVDHIRDIYEAEPCTEVMKPWLPPLAAEIINPNIANIEVGELPDTSFDVGVIDMPDKQKQEVYTHDFSKSGNMAIFGTSKVGKSTAATNAILSLAAKNSPNTLNMYIVDFGNTALFALKDLPQVADYISFDDTEKFRKLRNILSDEISARKKKFARYNVTTLEMYNASGSEIMPAIVVVIDNYDVIKEIDYDLENYFTQLTRDGVGVGIYTLVTATRANAMKYAVLNNFGARICNFMSDSSEIVSLIGRSEYKLSDIKGRALVSKDNVYLMQEFLPVRCEHKSHYNTELQRMVEAIKNANIGTTAEKISVLPDEVNFEEIILDKVDGDNRIAIGLDSEKVAPYYIDNRSQVKLILGPVQSGKTNALKVILEQLNNEKIFLFDSRTRDLDDYENSNNVVYADPASDIGEFIANFEDIIQTRERAYSKYDGNLKMKEFYASLDPISLIVEDVDICVEVLGSKVTEFNSLLCRGLATQIHVYATAMSNKLKGFDAVSKTVRDNAQSGIVLGDPQSQQIFAIRKNELGKERGMSYVYENGVIAMVKIPRM